MMFDFGDCLFLALVGLSTVVAMHLAHELGWGFAITCGAGMARPSYEWSTIAVATLCLRDISRTTTFPHEIGGLPATRVTVCRR